MTHSPRSLPILSIILVLFGSFSSAFAAGYLLQAGPMIGHVSDSSAVVWLRAKEGAAITATAIQGDDTARPSRTEELGEGFFRIHFNDLEPATQTEVTIEVLREEDPAESEKVRFKTAPPPDSTGTVRIAFGSCSKISQYGEGPIYRAIAEEQPDFSIFVGDNVYFIVGDGGDRHRSTTGPVGDWNFYESMMARHLRTRIHPDLQPMFRTVPSYAIWDDHDYGPNNADSTYPMKEEATRAFRRVWANPSYGTDQIEGIFSSFRHGPVEVFLMDNRTHKYSHARHDDVTREDGRIWGENQLNWLMAGLKASSAPVKLIANGTQFMSKHERAEGHWQESLSEQRRLLEFLAKEKIGGVAFLSGDMHFSEAMQQDQGDGTLVVEFTSSPLQQGQTVGPLNRPHENQLWGMHGNSYGLVTVDIPQTGSGTIRFEARDAQNAVPVIDGNERATTWELEQLNYK